MNTVVISPFNVVNFPDGGGHCWVYLQYVQGLRQMGCDVYWLEAFRSRGVGDNGAALLDPFLEHMERLGLGRKLLLYAADQPCAATGRPKEYVGRSRSEAEAILRHADLFLNFHYAIAPP